MIKFYQVLSCIFRVHEWPKFPHPYCFFDKFWSFVHKKNAHLLKILPLKMHQCTKFSNFDSSNNRMASFCFFLPILAFLLTFVSSLRFPFNQPKLNKNKVPIQLEKILDKTKDSRCGLDVSLNPFIIEDIKALNSQIPLNIDEKLIVGTWDLLWTTEKVAENLLIYFIF